MNPLRIGVIGCGNICGIYFDNLAQFPETEVVACADLDRHKAEAVAAQRGIRAETVLGLLADPNVDLILNLTVPLAHAEVNRQALIAGKHVYVEKPLAVTRADGEETLELAAQRGLLVGCAPDTFLGAGIQTCKTLIEEGAIGTPVAANAFMMCHGHESWHPAPAFYYQSGGGPLFDMGPYYLTAMIELMGNVSRVQGSARATFPQRTITSQPLAGTAIEVETPTHIVGVLDFASGAIGQVTMSFDVWSHSMPHIEIYGFEGTLQVPDPNGFGGPVRIRSAKDTEWQTAELRHPHAENMRGLGVREMAITLQGGAPHRASGELAFHVLDIMQSILTSSSTGQAANLSS